MKLITKSSRLLRRVYRVLLVALAAMVFQSAQGCSPPDKEEEPIIIIDDEVIVEYGPPPVLDEDAAIDEGADAKGNPA